MPSPRLCTSLHLSRSRAVLARVSPPRPQPAIPHTAVARQAEPPAPPPAAALLPLLRLHPRSGERPQTQTPPRRHRQPRSRPQLPARTLSPRRASEARREQPRRGDEGGGRKLRAVPAYICIQAHVHVDMRARACACARAVGVPSNWSKRAHLAAAISSVSGNGARAPPDAAPQSAPSSDHLRATCGMYMCARR